MLEKKRHTSGPSGHHRPPSETEYQEALDLVARLRSAIAARAGARMSLAALERVLGLHARTFERVCGRSPATSRRLAPALRAEIEALLVS